LITDLDNQVVFIDFASGQQLEQSKFNNLVFEILCTLEDYREEIPMVMELKRKIIKKCLLKGFRKEMRFGIKSLLKATL